MKGGMTYSAYIGNVISFYIMSMSMAKNGCTINNKTFTRSLIHEKT